MGEEKIFTEVIFPDLAKEEAVKLVETYNKVSLFNKYCFHYLANLSFWSLTSMFSLWTAEPLTKTPLLVFILVGEV